MAAYSTVEYAKQLLALSNGASQADGNKTGSSLNMARVRYTISAALTEAGNEVLTVWLAPAGATIIPALSSIYCDDVGTVFTGTVGTAADADAYSSALTLHSATAADRLQRWVPTTYPTELTEATAVLFTIGGTVTSLTAGTVIEFDIAYTVRH